MKRKSTQLVSVVMPTYNAGKFLRASIESILKQTYKNIELIVVDDNSSDDTPRILRNYTKLDKRIKVITSRINLGVSRAANVGISYAKGDFIARMDADDIAYPERIKKQISFLLKNKTVIAVGGQCELIDSSGSKIGYKRFPLKSQEIKEIIFSHVPLQQPTLMVNKKMLPKNFVWYDNNYSSAEELELIFKLFKYGQIRNLAQIVLKYRMHDMNTSLANPKKTFYLTLKTRATSIVRYGYRPSIKGIMTSIAQAIFVSLMPANAVYPMYMYLRGIKKITLKAIINALRAKINYGEANIKEALDLA